MGLVPSQVGLVRPGLTPPEPLVCWTTGKLPGGPEPPFTHLSNGDANLS